MSEPETKPKKERLWWVYVVQCDEGPFYVGCTTDPRRRIKEHNGGVKKKGGRYTSRFTNWRARALWGPYPDQSSALKAERTLKKKRGINRTRWTLSESLYAVGLGPADPWVKEDYDAHV